MDPRRRRISRRRRRRRGTLVVLFLLAATAGIFYGLNSPYFHLVRVEIHGLQHLDEAEVLDWTSLQAPVSLWRISTAEVAARLESHPRIAGAQVARRWPDTLIINLMERRPVVYIAYHDLWLAVDEAGIPFALEAEPPAGVLRLEGLGLVDQPLGSPLPTWSRGPVLCALLVSQFNMDWVRRITVQESGELVLWLEHDVPARLEGSEDTLRQQLAALSALWEQWREQADQVSYFDVRNPERPAVKVPGAEGDMGDT